ncbi:MAG: O-methyltransferase [Bacteroidia bacterium]
MEFIDENLEKYCLQHTSAENAVLEKLNRETHLKVMSPRMLSGHLQGSFLSLLSQLQQPEYILEIGTYTGYSAICLAQGLKEKGRLITIDVNEETESIARKYFLEAGLETKIDLRIGDAKKIIPELKEQFGLVFIDADKKSYSLYYDLVFDRLKPGALIIADNVLWSGKVLVKDEKMDADTLAIHEFNKKIAADARIEKVMLPLRDGLLLMRKK